MSNRRDEKERLEMLAKRVHFENLYFKWLEARAAEFDPRGDESDDAMAAKGAASDDAGRQLLVTPAFLDWMIWKKWEVLDYYLDEDALAGTHVDKRTVMALGCIKADLMHFGIGKT